MHNLRIPGRTGRRQFLSNLGALAAATAAAGTASLGPLAESAQATERAQTAADPTDSRRRAEQSFDRRVDAAGLERKTPAPQQTANGDEVGYPGFIGNFSKGLPHGPTGEVDGNAYEILLEAIDAGTSEAIESVPLGGTVKLVNPVAGVAFDLEGTDSHKFAIPPSPPLASQVRADEMVELYWMALCRDVNFIDYDSNPAAQTWGAGHPPSASYTENGGLVGTLGNFCDVPAYSFNSITVADGGPNNGYQYVTSVSPTYNGISSAYYYVISPDLQNASSTFSQAQCGNYNAQTNPNAYITQPNLLANVVRHCSSSAPLRVRETIS